MTMRGFEQGDFRQPSSKTIDCWEQWDSCLRWYYRLSKTWLRRLWVYIVFGHLLIPAMARDWAADYAAVSYLGQRLFLNRM